jgi:hypothetical protein
MIEVLGFVIYDEVFSSSLFCSLTFRCITLMVIDHAFELFHSSFYFGISQAKSDVCCAHITSPLLSSHHLTSQFNKSDIITPNYIT